MAATSPAIAAASAVICVASGYYVGALFCVVCLGVLLWERYRP